MAAGTCICGVSVSYDNGATLNFVGLTLQVASFSMNGAVESSNEFTALQEALAIVHDIDSKVRKTTEINGHALTDDITFGAADRFVFRNDLEETVSNITAGIIVAGHAGSADAANDSAHVSLADSALYAVNSGNVSHSMDIIDGNFQIVSNGFAYGSGYAGSSGYPIWDVWKWTAPDTKAGIARMGGAAVPGSYDYCRIYWSAGLTAGTSNYNLKTFLEKGVRVLCSYGFLTLSFWAKCDVSGTKMRVHFIQNYGTGGSPSSEDTQSKVITMTTAWQRYSVTFSPISISGKTFGTNNDDYLTFMFGVDGTPNTQSSAINLTRVQLDIGDKPLPYRNKSFFRTTVMYALLRNQLSLRNGPGYQYG